MLGRAQEERDTQSCLEPRQRAGGLRLLPHCISLTEEVPSPHTPARSSSQLPGQGYSRGQETPGAPGQAQAGDEADDQVQDEEQEVGKPPGRRVGALRWSRAELPIQQARRAAPRPADPPSQQLPGAGVWGGEGPSPSPPKGSLALIIFLNARAK